MNEERLSDHIPYVLAVRDALHAAGLETEYVEPLHDWAEPGPKEGRGAAIQLGGESFWKHTEFDFAVELSVEWHETRGWYVHETFELGAVRGNGHSYKGLGLGIVPAPATVATRLVEGFAAKGDLPDRGHTERKTGPYDAELERQLGVYGEGAGGRRSTHR